MNFFLMSRDRPALCYLYILGYLCYSYNAGVTSSQLLIWTICCHPNPLFVPTVRFDVSASQQCSSSHQLSLASPPPSSRHPSPASSTPSSLSHQTHSCTLHKSSMHKTRTSTQPWYRFRNLQHRDRSHIQPDASSCLLRTILGDGCGRTSAMRR